MGKRQECEQRRRRAADPATSNNAGTPPPADAKYQLLGPLRPDEYQALEADILKRGVQIPVEKDAEGHLLDGHHRAEIADKHSLPCPVVVRQFAGEAEKVEHVLKLNLARRHLDPLRWGRAFALLLEQRGARPGRGGDRKSTATVAVDLVAEIAAELGVSERTARSRVQQAKKYAALPPEEQAAVDAGEKTVHKADRQVRRREALEAAAAAVPAARSEGRPWEIRQADCVEALRDVAAGSARLVFADPPYNLGVDYGDGEQADRLPDADYVAWCARWIGECRRVLSDNGSFWLLSGDAYADYRGVELRKAGFHRRAWVKWYETFGVNQANNFNRCSRHLFYCVKDPKRFVFHADAVRRPSDRQTKYADERADPEGKLWDDVWEIPRLVGTAAERLPDFPTQLPLALLRPIIGCSSDPGDLVVDPFCGSATTGAAALALGRHFLGFEKQSRFVALAILRMTGVSAAKQGGVLMDGAKYPELRD